MNTIKALFIDLDGVIRLWDATHNAEAEQEAGLPPGVLLQTAFAPDLLHPAITGHTTDEAWRQQVTDRLQKEYPAANAALAVHLWSEPAGAVDCVVLELVRAARHKAQVILITNATTRLDTDLDRLVLTSEFDHVVNSSNVGYIKPQPEIFHAALHAAGIAPEEGLFIDDQPANVKAAQQLGIHGHLFGGATQLEQELARFQLL